MLAHYVARAELEDRLVAQKVQRKVRLNHRIRGTGAFLLSRLRVCVDICLSHVSGLRGVFLQVSEGIESRMPVLSSPQIRVARA